MLDRETPPAAEGEADDGGDAVHRIVRDSPAVAIVNKIAASTALLWITATAARSMETRGRAVAEGDPDLLRRIRRLNRSRFRRMTMPIRAFLLSLTICFFRRKFRKPHANSMSKSSSLRTRKICWSGSS